MQLDKLRTAIQEYKQLVQSPDYTPGLKWAATKQFQNHWKLLFTDLPEMYNNSINDRFIERFWGHRVIHPKAAMTLLIKYQPEQMEAAFRDLLNEEVQVERRIGRFLFMVDALLSDYKRAHENLNNHLHDGLKMISVYLSFAYPDRYALFDYPPFEVLMKRLGVVNIPLANDLERYTKILKNINRFLLKDEALIAAMQPHLERHDFYRGDSLLMAQDFVWWMGGQDH